MGHDKEEPTHTELLRKIIELEDELAEHGRSIRRIEQTFTKYRGFVGGILFVFSVSWAILTFLKSVILKGVSGAP